MNNTDPINLDISILYDAGDLISDGWFDWFIQDENQYISPKFWKILGYDYPCQSNSDKEWQKLIDKNDLKFFKKEYDKHIDSLGEYELSVPVRFLHKNGDTKWFICRGKVIQWYNKEPFRMIGTYTDITNFKKIQESFEKLNLVHEVVENMIDGSSFDICLSYDHKEISSVWKNHEKTFGEHKTLDVFDNYWNWFFQKVNSNFKEIVSGKIFKSLKDKKSYFESEFIMETDNKPQWFRCSIYLFYYKDHYRIIGMYRNINPYKENLLLYKDEKIKYEMEKEKFKLIFENSPIAKILTDQEGFIVKTNKSAENFFGYSIEELERFKYSDLIYCMESEKLIEKITLPLNILDLGKNSIKEVNYNGVNNRYWHKNGKVVWGSAKKSEVSFYDTESNANQNLYSIVDITKEKEKEKENKEIVDELSQFVFMASHDLQEPLRQTYNYTELLLESFEGSTLDENQEKYLKFILKGVDTSFNLIQDLLKFSRADKENEDLTQIDTLNLVNNAILSLNSYVLEKDGKIIIKNPEEFPKLFLHRVKIEQLFFNLIHNGLKYCNGVKPIITISCEKINNLDKEEKYLFKVEDNGIGIDIKYIEKIFNIFERLSNNYEGTGIGLAICKKTVEFYNGKIWVENNESKRGSSFKFTLKDFHKK